jgi:hypothetical protein
MSDFNSILRNMERSRAEWDKDKDGLTGPSSGRPLESLPTTVVAQHCEVCGKKFGVRVYYDNAASKGVGFCSTEHVQVYRQSKKAPAAPVAASKLARRTANKTTSKARS